ncbi:MAG: hypothetical protein JNL11_16285 [Bdellovibrionaceae bacterium]|nr:hypothetical protein [Pseudobdellovibrionaceae bacterium]
MKFNTLKKLSLVVLMGSFLTVAFNNCGKPKEAEESSEGSYSKLSDDPCEDQLMNFYARSYQPFLVQNCASCHATGPGKGQIANKDTTIAFKDFMQIGYSKVSSNAISDNHNAPYSGSHHTQTINELKVTWVRALSENDICKGGNGQVETVETVKERAKFGLVAKNIPAMDDNQERRIEFNLNMELSALKNLPVPNLSGAKISFMVRKVLKGTDRYYSVHSPRIFGASDDIHIKGIFTKINGRYIQYSTNFIFADARIPKGQPEAAASALVSTGAVVIAGTVFPEDKISFDFELLEKTEIPPPPPPVKLSFSGVRMFKAGASGEVTFSVQLDIPSSETVTFSYTVDSAAICNGGVVNGSTCLPEAFNVVCPSGNCPHADSAKLELARSVVGTSFNRFDWDYKLGTSSFSIEPGQTTKTFTIKTARDVRFERNRLLTLRLEPGLGSIEVPDATSRVRVVFEKILNPVPAIGEMTYSKLMAGGTLYKTCTECHNSVKRDGGYDIQDYELMISSNKQILVPGADSVTYDANFNKIITATSLMYRRTLPQFTPESYLMPRLKTLTPAEYNDLENWLTKGAKNN